jgi:hypothetical protein
LQNRKPKQLRSLQTPTEISKNNPQRSKKERAKFKKMRKPTYGRKQVALVDEPSKLLPNLAFGKMSRQIREDLFSSDSDIRSRASNNLHNLFKKN